MSVPRRVESILLFLAIFHVGEVVGKGGRKGGGSAGDIGDAISSLDLTPPLTAVFAITITVAVLTLFQLGGAAARFKKPVLPAGSPELPYQVGKLFPSLLFSYLLVFLVYNILYAVYIAVFHGRGSVFLSEGFIPGMWFVGQLADVLFFSMIFSIIAYRQRIQLHPAESLFNLVSFLQGWVLGTMFILGIAQDALAGASIGEINNDGFGLLIAVNNLSIASQAFYFIACIAVAVSATMAYLRFKKSEVQDVIIRNAAFFVTPFVLLSGIYRIIAVGISRDMNTVVSVDSLNIAGAVIGGIVSITVAAFALRMGAPPTPKKNAKEVETHKA